jgi:hypothetical protein
MFWLTRTSAALAAPATSMVAARHEAFMSFMSETFLGVWKNETSASMVNYEGEMPWPLRDRGDDSGLVPA